jgi:hypothetical protein
MGLRTPLERHLGTNSNLILEDTMADHTPGPWSITGPNIREDGTGALLFVQQSPFHDYESDPEEQAANLQLAAAAPKLKAIVEGFLGTLATSRQYPDCYETWHNYGRDSVLVNVTERFYNENIELFNVAIDTIQELRGE